MWGIVCVRSISIRMETGVAYVARFLKMAGKATNVIER